MSLPRRTSRLPVLTKSTQQVVGEVLKDRKKRGQIEYLIRWKNFGAEEDSWEPASNLLNAGSILQEYIQNKASRKSRRSSRSRSRSQSRTRALRKKAEKEVDSRESTPLKKSSRESTPLKKREPTPIKSLETSAPIEDLEKPPIKEVTPVLEDTIDSPPLKVVTELTNEGVEETLLTTFTSQITTETTEILTPVSESVSTVLTRRMEMRAAAKATELEEEQKIIEEEVKEQKSTEIINEEEVSDTLGLDGPTNTKPAAEEVTTTPRQSLINVSGRKWPIVVFIVCLLVVGISFLVEKYFRS